MSELREQLAELAHSQWSGWMRYMFSKCEPFVRGGTALVIPDWAVTRWAAQMNTPYAELSEAEQNSDRAEADKFLAVFEQRAERAEAALAALEEAGDLVLRSASKMYRGYWNGGQRSAVGEEALCCLEKALEQVRAVLPSEKSEQQ